MGASHSSSHLSKRQRPPSIHSKPSRSALHPIPPPHQPFSSANGGKANDELKENLPENLKVYSNSIEILHNFWYSEIESLSETAYKETAILLYCNIFKVMPEARQLIKKPLEEQAIGYFQMLEWFISNLVNPNKEQLTKKIRMLGKLHIKLNITQDMYDIMLQALHETMTDRAKEKYTARVRFCMTQLTAIHLCVNIMMGRDLACLSSAKISNLLKSLTSLENCLEDEEACTYLELFARETFCVELILFYKDYRSYCESSLSAQQRIGREILRKYLEVSAECEINVSYATKQAVYESLKENHHVFQVDIFDPCMREITDLIRTNLWLQFKQSITRMATDHDINYEQIQIAKASESNMHRSHNCSHTAANEQTPTSVSQSTSTFSKKVTQIQHQDTTSSLLASDDSDKVLHSSERLGLPPGKKQGADAHSHTPSLNESTTSMYDLNSLLVID